MENLVKASALGLRPMISWDVVYFTLPKMFCNNVNYAVRWLIHLTYGSILNASRTVSEHPDRSPDRPEEDPCSGGVPLGVADRARVPARGEARHRGGHRRAAPALVAAQPARHGARSRLQPPLFGFFFKLH